MNIFIDKYEYIYEFIEYTNMKYPNKNLHIGPIFMHCVQNFNKIIIIIIIIILKLVKRGTCDLSRVMQRCTVFVAAVWIPPDINPLLTDSCSDHNVA